MKTGHNLEMEGIVPARNYTVQELACIFRMADQTIYNKLSCGGDLPRCFRIGNQVRFRGADIIKFIEQQLEG